MVERTATLTGSHQRTGLQGFPHKGACLLNCLNQSSPQSQISRHRAGQRAAGAMGVGAVNARRLHPQGFTVSGDQQIHNDVSGQVPALEQDSARALGQQSKGGLFHILGTR